MRIKKLMLYSIVLSMLCTISIGIHAQDTIKVTIQSAEKQFLERNLQLLAERCNIDIAKAGLIQAKLFDNPSFSAGIDIYNPENERWFDASKNTGQYMFSLEQLIRLGGKRNKEISMAKIGVQMSENQFYDLLRTLRFSLNSVFYEAYYTLRSLHSFDAQIALLEDLQESYKELKNKGVVSLNEVVRIQSLLYSIKSDKLELQSAFNDLEAQLQLLLQDNRSIYIPEVTESGFAFLDPRNFQVAQLVSEAYYNRVDLKIAKNELNYNQENLSLQKAIAVPDVTVGAEYDKRGSFTDNLFSLNVSFDLPFFNRNKGNIYSAKAAVKQKQYLVDQKQTEIENEVLKSYLDALDADKIQRSIDPDFEKNLQSLLQNITENFRKRNIGMLEFTDFYESYRDNIIKINQIQNKKVQTMEKLRFVVGEEMKVKN